MKAIPDARIVAARTQRPAFALHPTSAFVDRITASSHGNFMAAYKPIDRGGADDAGIVRIVLRVGTVKFHNSLVTFSDELFRDRLMTESMAG
jgi:hypothetical protein